MSSLKYTAYSEVESAHGATKNSPGHFVTGSTDDNNYSLDGGGGRDSGRSKKSGASRSPSASNSDDDGADKGLRKRQRVVQATYLLSYGREKDQRESNRLQVDLIRNEMVPTRSSP